LLSRINTVDTDVIEEINPINAPYGAILIRDTSGSNIDMDNPQIAPKAEPSKIQLRVWGKFNFMV
jgi:hypothetical protein